MNSFLFEHFWIWLLVGLAASVVSFMMAMQRRTRFWLNAAKIVPIFFCLLLVVNSYVVTDREAIRNQLGKIITACTTGDPQALGNCLDNDFSANGLTKQEFLDQAREAFSRLNIEQVRLSEVILNPASSVVKLASFAHIVAKGGTNFGWIRSDWELTFRKRDTTWLLYDVQPLSLYMQPVKDIREIFNRSRQVQ